MDLSFLESLLGKGAAAGASEGAVAGPGSTANQLATQKAMDKTPNYKGATDAFAKGMGDMANNEVMGAPGQIVNPNAMQGIPENVLRQQALQDMIAQYTAKK